MLVIKVFGLPSKTSENQLNKIVSLIGITLVSTDGVYFDQQSTACFFPKDMLQTGLGEEIIIEVTGFVEKINADDARQRLAEALVNTVSREYPRTRVECFVNSFGRWGFSAHIPEMTK